MDSIPQKQCTKCGIEYPATTEYFNKNCKAKDGLHPNCKTCRRKYREENHEHIHLQKKTWRENNPEKESERVVKWIEENRDYYLQSKRDYYYRNHERIRVIQKDNYEKNKHNYSVKQAAYYQQHKVEIRLREKRRMDLNPVLRVEAKHRTKQWRKDNPEQYKQLIKAAKQLRRNIPGKVTTNDLNDMYQEQEGRCCFCGITIYWSIDRDVHLEHHTPVSRGGTNNRDNVGLSCQGCNLSKHQKTLQEWMEVRGW